LHSFLLFFTLPESCAHNGSVLQVQYTHDGFHLVSYGSDKQIRYWDMTNYRNAHIFQSHGVTMRPPSVMVPCHQFDLLTENVTTPVAFIPDEYEVALLDMHSGDCFDVLKGHCRKVSSTKLGSSSAFYIIIIIIIIYYYYYADDLF
jgi:WD40 repeat protein